jgi:PAS domain S-box-containing protein
MAEVLIMSETQPGSQPGQSATPAETHQGISSDTRYRTLIERMPVVAYINSLDITSSVLYISPQIEALLGYTAAAWMADPTLWFKALHPDDRDTVLEQLYRCQAGGEPLQAEYRLLAPGGQFKWVRDEALVVRDDDGRPLYLQGVLLDISRRKRAEKRSLAFSALGQQLSATATPEAAARVIAEVSDELLGWDAFVLSLYRADSDTITRVLAFDIVDGRRVEVPALVSSPAPGPLTRLTLDSGPRLYSLEEIDQLNPLPHAFGDQGRPSEALMFVPIRHGAAVIGVLSIQSYTPGIYSRADLETLQALADHASGAIERIQAEEALRESEQRFRTLIRDLHVGVILQGPRAEILHSNQAALDLLGLSEDQLLGKTSLDPDWNVIHEDGTPFPGPAQPVPQAIATRRPVRDVVMGVFRPISGDRVWLLVDAEPQLAPNGEVRQVICSFSDITARRQAELAVRELNDTLEQRVAEQTQELREAEAHYRTLVEQIPAITYVAALNDLVTTLYISPQIEDILGFPQLDWLGDPKLWIEQVHPDDRERMLAGRMRARADKPRSPVEYRMIASDGRIVWLRDEAVLVHNDSGEPLALQGIIFDVTERRQMEAALEAERSSLARRVEERTAELRAANAELARAARLKDEFLASVSHELRTPLNIILGMSETIQERVYGPLTDEQAEAIHNVEESGRHLLALINDILDLSKIEAGRLALVPGPVSIEEISATSLSMVGQIAQQKHLTVALEHDPTVPTITADPRRLKQMLVNLLSNAVKFTPAGGSIGLQISADSQRGVVHFTVWDTGIGIAPEDLNQLFRPFVQLDSRLSREYMGTGLGLVLVERMAGLHGGKVSVESKPGHGSRFTITLPTAMSYDEAAPPSSPSAPEASGAADVDVVEPAQRPRILVADDNAETSAMYSRYLGYKGYEVLVANNGAEVLERARELRPDLILMDIQMPGIDGLEATRQIRADPVLGQVPIIALTAMAMPGDRARCLEAGMNAYLSKPIGLQILLAEIQSAIARRS